MSAFVTASRSGASGRVTCAASWWSATGMPAASSAGVYWLGPPGSQPSTAAPAQAPSSAAADAPGAGGTHDVDPLALPDRPRLAGGCKPGADRGGAADAHAVPARGAASTWASRSSIAAAALARLFAERSPSQWKRRTTGVPNPTTATYARPTGFASVPAARTRDAGHGDAEVGLQPLPHALGHRQGDLCRHGPVGGEDVLGHAQLRVLDLVGVGDDAATHVRRRARHLGQGVDDEAARARFGGGEGQPETRAPGLEALGELDERVRHVSCGWS